MELTVREIDSAKPTNKQYKLADGRGLCLLVMPSGGNTVLVQTEVAAG